jgi:hypothetical protein
MPHRLAIFTSLLALLAAALPARAAPLSLTLNQPRPERPYALDISGSYGESPAAIIVRDSLYGGVIGTAGGALVGLAADSNHVGRDIAIGAVIGLGVGALVGVADAQSGPHITVHTDRVGLTAPF